MNDDGPTIDGSIDPETLKLFDGRPPELRQCWLDSSELREYSLANLWTNEARQAGYGTTKMDAGVIEARDAARAVAVALIATHAAGTAST